MALKIDRTVWAWGKNDFGQLGHGIRDYGQPVAVAGLNNVVQICAGSYHSLALTSSLQDALVSVDNRTGKIGQLVSLRAILKRASDFAAIANRTLTFKVGATTVGQATTNAQGAATLYYIPSEALGTGSQTVTVSFAGDTFFSTASGTGKLTVSKGDTAIVRYTASGNVGQSVKLIGRLYRLGDSVTLAGRTLVFKVEGTQVGTATTDANGFGTFLYSIPDTLSAGDHAFTVEFAGDANYNAGSVSSTLTVSKADTSLSRLTAAGKVGQTVKLGSRLKRLTDNAVLVGKTVTIKLEGTVVGTVTTGADGVGYVLFTIPNTLSAGDHVFTVEFAGDTAYNASSISSTLTVQ